MTILFIYTFSFLLGAVVTTLTIAFAIKQKTEINRCFRTLSLSLLLYLVFEYFVYYKIDNSGFGLGLSLLITMCNISYYIYIYHWIKILALASDIEFVPMKLIFKMIVLYGFMAETIGLFMYKYNTDNNFLQIEEQMWQNILAFMNFAFVLFVIIIAVKYLLFAFNKMPDNSNSGATILFSSILIMYSVWVIYWDYSMVRGRNFDLGENYTADPMIYIFIAYSLAVIWFFFKNDPFEIKADKIKVVEEKKDLMFRAEKEFSLSAREMEVIEAVMQGLSNPEIGETLFIAENTVKRHLNTIFKKTNTKSRFELIAKLKNFN